MSCGSSNSGSKIIEANSFCCPNQEIFVEKLCGNANGPFTSSVWKAPALNDYIQGTFTVTNESATGAIAISVNGVRPATFIPPGTTVHISATRPKSFDIYLDCDEQAKYCITLYKRVG